MYHSPSECTTYHSRSNRINRNFGGLRGAEWLTEWGRGWQIFPARLLLSIQPVAVDLRPGWKRGALWLRVRKRRITPPRRKMDRDREQIAVR